MTCMLCLPLPRVPFRFPWIPYVYRHDFLKHGDGPRKPNANGMFVLPVDRAIKPPSSNARYKLTKKSRQILLRQMDDEHTRKTKDRQAIKHQTLDEGIATKLGTDKKNDPDKYHGKCSTPPSLSALSSCSPTRSSPPHHAALAPINAPALTKNVSGSLRRSGVRTPAGLKLDAHMHMDEVHKRPVLLTSKEQKKQLGAELDDIIQSQQTLRKSTKQRRHQAERKHIAMANRYEGTPGGGSPRRDTAGVPIAKRDARGEHRHLVAPTSNLC